MAKGQAPQPSNPKSEAPHIPDAKMSIQYSPPSISPKRKQAVERGDFDFLMPFEKALYRTDEVGDAIGRDPKYVRELIDCGRLEAQQDSASGARKSNLVTRRSVLIYLAETANYDPASIVLRIEVIIKTLKPAALDRIIDAARRQRERIT